jgi:hypothetical protein
MSNLPAVMIYSRSEEGHRADYIRFVSGLFRTGRTSAVGTCTSRLPVLFLMVEEFFSLYVVACLWRSLWGRRTVGLLFRPGPALEGKSLRLRVKRRILRLLRRLPRVQTLTIVPFSIAPRFAEIADGWIYDLQLWDKSVPGSHDLLHTDHAALPLKIREAAGGRAVIGALGLQDRHKGFDVFAGVWNDDEGLRKRFLFAFGGTVSPSLRDMVESFGAAGGFGLDRRITDEELLGLYGSSDLVWCLYDAAYDQASGILGRAVQFGIPAIVREQSLSHKFCLAENIPHIATNAQTVAAKLTEPLPASDRRSGAAVAERFRRESLKTLTAALGMQGAAS